MSESFKSWLAQVPNFLTLSRGIIAIFLPYLIFKNTLAAHSLAAALFTIGAISDFVDGYLARRYHLISSFGKIADPITDKMITLLPLWAFSELGYYPLFGLIPVFIREIGITVLRIIWLMEGAVIAAERLGKRKLVLQVTTIGFSFLYLLFQYAGSTGILAVLGIIVPVLFWAMVILTVYSGIDVCVKNRALFRKQPFAKFVSALGVGLIPFAPGTWGSALALPLIAWFHHSIGGYVLVFVLLFLMGWWAVSQLDLSREKDPGFVVVDETCGMLLAFALIPFTWQTAVAGFILFRLFDIFKPFPIRYFERLPGYWGIMADDLAAGVYVWLILHLVFV